MRFNKPQRSSISSSTEEEEEEEAIVANGRAHTKTFDMKFAVVRLYLQDGEVYCRVRQCLSARGRPIAGKLAIFDTRREAEAQMEKQCRFTYYPGVQVVTVCYGPDDNRYYFPQ